MCFFQPLPRLSNTSVKEEISNAKKTLNELLTIAVQNTIQTKYKNAENKYKQEYELLSENFESDNDIRELFEIGLYNSDDIKSKVDRFHYNSKFPERTEYFTKYEISLDDEASEVYKLWQQKSKRTIESA